MARRVNKHQRAHRPLSTGSLASVTEKSDGRWIVRTITGTAAQKTYTCPGCQRTITAGTAHVVAWPSEPEWGVERASDARRHWHTHCWNTKR